MERHPEGHQHPVKPESGMAPVTLDPATSTSGEGAGGLRQPATATAAVVPATEPVVQLHDPSDRVCATCGNKYARMFEVVTHDGQRRFFDSFECAIHLVAPTCDHCGCRIVGHGLEAGTAMYCCANCARSAGERALVDHVEPTREG